MRSRSSERLPAAVDDEHVGGVGVQQRGGQGERRLVVGERDVDHVGVVVDRVEDRLGERLGAAAALGVDDAQRHDPRAGGGPEAAAHDRAAGDDPGDVGAVAAVVGGDAVAVEEVRAVDVVDEAVEVVVDPVAGDLVPVAPHQPLQRRVRRVDAGVDDGDDRVGGGGHGEQGERQNRHQQHLHAELNAACGPRPPCGRGSPASTAGRRRARRGRRARATSPARGE